MKDQMKIGIIGDYDSKRPSHIATNAALSACSDYLGITLDLEWMPTISLETDLDFKDFHGILCSPGIYQSPQGALNAIRYAREHDYPFLATCQGFQHAVIEYARNCLRQMDVEHVEFKPEAANLIITPLSCSFVGETRKVFIDSSSRVFSYYKTPVAVERFTCNFGINPSYRSMIHESGFRIVGTDENDEVRILELVENAFFVATLFQPQMMCTIEDPHKLLLAFLHVARLHGT